MKEEISVQETKRKMEAKRKAREVCQEVLNRLCLALDASPHERVGQLITNAVGDCCMFSVSDVDMRDALKNYTETGNGQRVEKTTVLVTEACGRRTIRHLVLKGCEVDFVVPKDLVIEDSRKIIEDFSC